MSSVVLYRGPDGKLAGVDDKAHRHFSKFKRAVDANPKDPYALKGLGLAYMQLRRYREAVVALRKALVINPYFVDVRNDLGTALVLAGRRAEAKAEFNAAFIDSTNPTTELPASSLSACGLPIARPRPLASNVSLPASMDPVRCASPPSAPRYCLPKLPKSRNSRLPVMSLPVLAKLPEAFSFNDDAWTVRSRSVVPSVVRRTEAVTVACPRNKLSNSGTPGCISVPVALPVRSNAPVIGLPLPLTETSAAPARLRPAKPDSRDRSSILALALPVIANASPSPSILPFSSAE